MYMHPTHFRFYSSPSSTILVYSNTCTGVYKQRIFTYTGKHAHMLWKEYGTELHFPSTFKVHIEDTVSVISTDGDNYIFPEGSELVSAIYDISTNEPFPELVTIKLQHCVPIDSEKAASATSFVIASTLQGPPYEFHPLDGGIFRSGSYYADIELTHFSMPAVVRWCRWLLDCPIPFCASVYYLQNSIVSFAVTKSPYQCKY